MTKPDKEETTTDTNETIETPPKKDDTKKTETKKVIEPEVNSKDSIKDIPKTTPLEKTKVGWGNLFEVLVAQWLVRMPFTSVIRIRLGYLCD